MKKNYIIIIIIAVGVIGGLLSSGVWNPVWNPFTSQRNLNKAIGKLTEISLFKAEGNGWVE